MRKKVITFINPVIELNISKYMKKKKKYKDNIFFYFLCLRMFFQSLPTGVWINKMNSKVSTWTLKYNIID